MVTKKITYLSETFLLQSWLRRWFILFCRCFGIGIGFEQPWLPAVDMYMWTPRRTGCADPLPRFLSVSAILDVAGPICKQTLVDLKTLGFLNKKHKRLRLTDLD